MTTDDGIYQKKKKRNINNILIHPILLFYIKIFVALSESS